MTEVLFPPLSTERPEAEGVLSSWFVDDGQHVDAGQTLAEVQVDKVAADVPAPRVRHRPSAGRGGGGGHPGPADRSDRLTAP